MTSKPGTSRLLWAYTLILVAIGVAAVVHRLLTLAPGASDPARFDPGFAQHAALTAAHIVPGLLFVVLGPLQFMPALRAHHPRLHRWTGRIVLTAGITCGVTALMMAPQLAIGGINETAATTLFALLFLFSLAKGYLAARGRRFATHREWMIRAFAIGLAVAFIRPIVFVFFATSGFTHLTPREFFGTAFWLGFTIQTFAAEVWINVKRRQAYTA